MVARAFEGCHLFATDSDREFIVATAQKVFAETRTRCHAWAILSNHYHLLLQCDSTPPGVVIHKLNMRVARRARRLRGENGPIFQDRYFSRQCTDDRGYEELLAYVLGNPLHHRVVESVDQLEQHRWSGLRELTGSAPARLVDVPSVLKHFDADPRFARAALRQLLRNKASAWDGSEDALVPSSDVVRGAVEVPSRLVADESLRPGLKGIVGIIDPVVGDWSSKVARRWRLDQAGWKPRALLRIVCARLGADVGAVRTGGRSAAEACARAVLAFLACDYVGVPVGEMARLTGVAGSALASARRRGRSIVERLGWDPRAVVEESRAKRRRGRPSLEVRK